MTKHGMEKADAEISQFSNRELLMAGLLREAMFHVNNEAYERSHQSLKDSGHHHTQRDLKEYVTDRDNQRNAVEIVLTHHNGERYDDIKADDVLEFADGLSDRVYKRITSPNHKLNLEQHYDTLHND